MNVTAAATSGKALGELSPAARQRAQLKKATQDFEAIFVGTLFKEMRKTMSGDNPLFGNSSETKHYQEMMDDTVAQNLSKTGAFGLGNMLYKKVERTLPPDPEAITRQALGMMSKSLP